MSYDKHEWSAYEMIAHSLLNHIEDGVKDNDTGLAALTTTVDEAVISIVDRLDRLEAVYGVTFTEQPQAMSVAAGGTATFHVAVDQTGVTYQWQVRGNGVSEWQNTSLGGADTDTLSFTAIQGFNGRLYRCIVTLSNGYHAASGSAKLTVTAANALGASEGE